MKQQKGLGRGLDALFITEDSPKSSPTTQNIPLDKISANPTQPRREFGDEELRELAHSIAELGVIQPITVRCDAKDRYTIISGERRYRAAQMAGLTEIPAYIREADDEQMHTMALVENILREDLNPLEIAIALQRLIEECGLTQEALSQRVSMKRSSISNYLRLLKLAAPVQHALKSGSISMGHAKAIASIESESGQCELLQLIEQQGLTVRQAESAAARLSAPVKPAKSEQKSTTPTEYEPLTRHLTQIFPKGVTLKVGSRGAGRIVINYSNKSELMQLIKELGIDG